MTARQAAQASVSRNQPDYRRFATLVEAALVAFATDDRYAVRMARRAVNIQRSRQHHADLARQRAEPAQGV